MALDKVFQRTGVASFRRRSAPASHPYQMPSHYRADKDFDSFSGKLISLGWNEEHLRDLPAGRQGSFKIKVSLAGR